MLAIGLFYLLFLILLIVLIFVILLYSGYHSRTLVPPLLNTVYGLAGSGGTDFNTTSYASVYLADGTHDYEAIQAGLCGSLDFGTSPAGTYQQFAFQPMVNDRQRKLSGSVTMLASKKDDNVSSIRLRLRDTGDNKIVASATDFSVKPYNEGLTEIKLYFNSNSLDNNNYHQFVLEGQAIDNNLTANNMFINSAYLYYY